MIDLILPSEEEIRKLAHDYFDMRGGEHGWDVADWLLAERIARFHKNYERVALYHYSSDSQTFLGNRKSRVCRYCGKTNARVSFSKDAHAIPAFLGNRSVFSLYECNECNDAFSEYLEDHFAKMLHGVRTAMRINGRKSVPNYKTRQRQTRIDVVGDRIEIKQIIGDPVVSLDHENQSATFSLETQPFIPLAVYKCLAKMALSVMPESELSFFADTMTWVRDRDHAKGAQNFANACAYRAMSQGPLPERYGWVELFRRRHESIRIPYMVLVVVCMNLTFQIHVPLCSKDQHLMGQQLTIPRFPAGFICGFEYGEPEFKNMNLSSPEPIAVPVDVNLRSDITKLSP
jgi:hypothetical protein